MTTPETDAAQFTRRYGDVKEQVDKLRDAVYVAGPSNAEHRQAMSAVNAAVPEFFMSLAFALGAYVNNQPGELDKDTLDAVVSLVTDHGSDAREAALDSGADVLGGALNDLGISLRTAGLVEWVDKTPDA